MTMSKETFLKDLSKQLRRSKVDDYQEYVNDYRELIDDRSTIEGASEASVITELGQPRRIVSSILDEEGTTIKKHSLSFTVLMVILLILGSPLWGSLLLAALAIVLAAMIIVWLIPFLLVVLAFSLLVTSAYSTAASFVAIFATGIAFGFTQLGLAIIVLGFGLVCTKLSWWAIKYFAIATQKFALATVNLFRRIN